MRQRLLQWLGCALCLLATPVLCADRPWKTAATPQYVLISQANDYDTLAWMRGFDQFILSTSDMLELNLKALPPLTVVLFNSDKDYTSYKLKLPNGQTAGVGGQFIRRRTWSAIGMSPDSNDTESRRTIHHEATHWLMSMDQHRQPAWFSEGIAEMFSTFERRGDKVSWAKPIGEHLDTLERGTMPLQQFLIEPSAIFDRDERTQRFYAQAWAFTYFLMFSKNSQRRPLMLKFLERFRMESGEAAVATVFGDQLPQVEHDFQLFIGQHSFPYVTQPVHAAPDPPALQPAPPTLVEASLGLLALGAERPELAQKHAARAIALDAESPRGYELLAYLALDRQEFDQAATQAEAALQRGSKDSDLYMLMGDSYAMGRNAQQPDSDRARVNMYENAINLNPRRLDVYERLVQALYPIEKPREDDLRFLQLGLRAFPGEDWLKAGAAMVEYRLGRHENALAAIDHVLRPESTLDAQQRENAVNLQRGWLVEQMNSELGSATSRQDMNAALELVARYRELLGDVPEIASYLDELEANLKKSAPPARRAKK